MTDHEIRSRLTDRLGAVEARIQAACARAGRSRAEVTLIAVTKTVGVRVARLLPELGVLDLGESRPQELWRKAALLDDAPIRWHQVGHLQRNKIERTLPLVDLIHSTDSLRLLEAINKEAEKKEQPASVMLEVNVSGEPSKHGFSPNELMQLDAGTVERFTSVEVVGLMTMAPYTNDPEECRPTFRQLRQLRDEMQGRARWNFLGAELPLLSMGMSNDFEVAIEEGATHIRLGTVLFDGLPADGEAE
jgi:PLP dependent protein